MEQYQFARQPVSQGETVSQNGTLENRFRTYSFGLGGGNSRATTVSVNPTRPCDPSQNGLFADCPQRHSPIAARPAKPNALPCGSTISKSPSTRIEPLLPTVIFVAAIFTFFYRASEICIPRTIAQQPSLSNFRVNTWEPTDRLHPTTPESRP